MHRIGQQREVMIYRLVTRSTYEAEMFERASRKLGLDKVVLASLEQGMYRVWLYLIWLSLSASRL